MTNNLCPSVTWYWRETEITGIAHPYSERQPAAEPKKPQECDHKTQDKAHFTVSGVSLGRNISLLLVLAASSH